MKYIRTENGIYEVSEKATYCGKNFYYTTAEVTLEDVDVISQADTIEELCDDYVMVNKDWKKPSFVEKEIADKWHLKEKATVDKGYTIYGAIWTSKGLIYVAKLNDKGELVLI